MSGQAIQGSCISKTCHGVPGAANRSISAIPRAPREQTIPTSAVDPLPTFESAFLGDTIRTDDHPHCTSGEEADHYARTDKVQRIRRIERRNGGEGPSS